MSGTGTFTFDPKRFAALGRLSAEINARLAPLSISGSVAGR